MITSSPGTFGCDDLAHAERKASMAFGFLFANSKTRSLILMSPTCSTLPARTSSHAVPVCWAWMSSAAAGARAVDFVVTPTTGSKTTSVLAASPSSTILSTGAIDMRWGLVSVAGASPDLSNPTMSRSSTGFETSCGSAIG